MGHGWMMVGCAAMLVVVIALVVSGAASTGLVVGAGFCVLMMGSMMAGMTIAMSRGRARRRNERPRS